MQQCKAFNNTLNVTTWLVSEKEWNQKLKLKMSRVLL